MWKFVLFLGSRRIKYIGFVDTLKQNITNIIKATNYKSFKNICRMWHQELENISYIVSVTNSHTTPWCSKKIFFSGPCLRWGIERITAKYLIKYLNRIKYLRWRLVYVVVFLTFGCGIIPSVLIFTGLNACFECGYRPTATFNCYSLCGRCGIYFGFFFPFHLFLFIKFLI